MAQPEQKDYFFVVESEAHYGAAIYARGEGMQTLSALARLTLIHLAPDESDFAIEFGANRQGDLYTSILGAIAGSQFKAPVEFAEVRTDALQLSEVMHATDTIAFDQRLIEHNNRLLGQLQDGARSAQSIHQEMITQVEDKRRVKAASACWFDENGVSVTPPFDRGGSITEIRTPRPALRRVTKNTRLDATTKEKLFDGVPKNGKAYSAAVTQLKRDRYGFIDRRRPFLYGVKGHTMYGFTPRGSTEFVPLFTRLSGEHPFAREVKRTAET